MGWIENQLQILTQRVETIYRYVYQDLPNQIKAANQGLRASYQQPTTTSSGGGVVYFCCPSSSISGGSGCPGSGSPGGPATGVSVYTISGGAYSLVTNSGSVYNAMPDSTTIGYLLICGANPDGTYTAISQACGAF